MPATVLGENRYSAPAAEPNTLLVVLLEPSTASPLVLCDPPKPAAQTPQRALKASAASGAALPGIAAKALLAWANARPPLSAPTVGSSITPMNWFMASKVACWVPTAVSPETWVKPAGVSVMNTAGTMFPRLKELKIALPTLRWLVLKSASPTTPFPETTLRSRKTSVGRRTLVGVT